ncbi:MAG: glycoside hydrolase family 3 N-terminal domain-containing protein [Bacteroidia bacterium]
MKRTLIALLPFIILTCISARLPVIGEQASEGRKKWVDSVMADMSVPEKIGQLIMVDAYSNKDATYETQLLTQSQTYHIGGYIFMQGSPDRQRSILRRLQSQAKIPLMIAMDAEWGLSMRMKNTPSFPKQMTLGAIRDDSLLYHFGKELAWQLKAVGGHVNFAPVIDINNNPRNPVIDNRSFGDNPYRVARKGLMLARGMTDGGVMPVGKHFPGHGDTDTDSHHDLPVLPYSAERLDSLELYPFMKASKAGMPAMMVGHLHVPVLDNAKNRPSSLSKAIVTDVLRERLGYKGLIFTDGLNMKGVTKYAPGRGEPALEALKAGNDILLIPENVRDAANRILAAAKSGEIKVSMIDDRVRRILTAKYNLGLRSAVSVPGSAILERTEARIMRKHLFEAALTLVRNDSNLIPLKKLDTRFALLNVSGGMESFTSHLKTYGAVRSYSLPAKLDLPHITSLARQLRNYPTVIISIPGSYRRSRRYGIPASLKPTVEALRGQGQKVIITYFGSPYGLANMPEADAILLGYETAKEAQVAAASAIFGGIGISGRLPVTASASYKEGSGITTSYGGRYGFGIPEEEGMDHRVLKRIDSLAKYYIQRGAMPGCAVLVGKGNKVVYAKGFGHTEPGGKPIDPYYHTYDLASVTKVAATTVCAMKFTEAGLLSLDKPIVRYLGDLKGTNKARLTPRRLLQHNAGLPAWRPFFRDTYSDPVKKTPDPRYYSTEKRDSFTVTISPKLHATATLHDTLWEWIKDMEVKSTDRVRYSDIGLLLTERVLQKISGGTSLDRLAHMHFYRDLGMVSTGFKPGERGLENRCPPSAVDDYWRREKLQGYVHDEASAVFGGVAGHAGLFSNTYDLAKLFFMLKNGGTYGNQQYLRPETVEAFTRQQLKTSRKGLGWDRPETSPYRSNPASKYSSSQTFGHTGFTGTCVWVDPEYDVVFIFLSNRTYPNPRNKLLNREGVRSKIFNVVYESIFSYRRQEAGHTLVDGSRR